MVDRNESYVNYVKALKDLEGLWSKDEFNSFCYWLTISKLNDHPNYPNWTPQNGRFQAFENAKKHLFSVYNFTDSNKIDLESNLEELLQFSYGMMQKKKASEIIQKELGHSITPIPKVNRDYSKYEYFKNRGRLANKMEEISSSMMCLRLEDKNRMAMMEDTKPYHHRRNSFEENTKDQNFSSGNINLDNSREQVNVQRDNPEGFKHNIGGQVWQNIRNDFANESMKKGSPILEGRFEPNQDINMNELMTQSYPNK